MPLLTILLLSVPITFWDFDFCDKYDWWHTLSISDDVISENKIEICSEKGLTQHQMLFAVLHELGHQYWFLYLSYDEREQYRALQTDDRADYYRDYSMTDVEEDFADNFANIMLGRDWLNKSDEYRAKQQFIRDLISKYE